MPFSFEKLELPEVILITPKTFQDDRGFFFETYQDSDFKANGIDVNFVQDNHSMSKKGVLRGLHYQINPKAQGKLVRVVSGKIYDVVVDIRQGSPNFGKWVSVELSAENRNLLWVPAGFAHGILALEDNTELLYKVTDYYSPGNDRSILWNDSAIGIKWPISKPDLSEKDLKAPTFKNAEINFHYQAN